MGSNPPIFNGYSISKTTSDSGKVELPSNWKQCRPGLPVEPQDTDSHQHVQRKESREDHIGDQKTSSSAMAISKKQLANCMAIKTLNLICYNP